MFYTYIVKLYKAPVMGAFFMGNNMEKTSKNKLKDYRRTKGKKWVDTHTEFSKRTSGSGLKFGGKYVEK